MIVSHIPYAILRVIVAKPLRKTNCKHPTKRFSQKILSIPFSLVNGNWKQEAALLWRGFESDMQQEVMCCISGLLSNAHALVQSMTLCFVTA
jgi:hypothetical protein